MYPSGSKVAGRQRGLLLPGKRGQRDTLVYSFDSARLVLNRWLVMELYRYGCGGGIIVVVGLQGDNKGHCQEENGAKRMLRYSLNPIDLVLNAWLMVELHRNGR